MSNSSNNQTNNTDDQDDRPALTPSISYVKRLEEENQRLKQQQQQQQEPAQQEQTQNDEQDGCGDNNCALFLSSSLGWTPELYNKINKVKCGESTCLEWSQAIFYSFAFIVDLADAVFDLILAFQTLYGGGDDGGKGLGILLGIMTIVGRFITGLYGGYSKRNTKDDDEEYKATAYLFMELTVFMLEDGAAILLLAKTTNSSSLDVLQTISLCLTLTCAGAFILVFFGLFVRGIRQDGCCYDFGDCIFVSVLLAVIAFPTFMICILIQEVLVKGEDDPPFSGGLELASYIIYGIGASIIGLLSILGFMFAE